jgi:hypothetical protein
MLCDPMSYKGDYHRQISGRDVRGTDWPSAYAALEYGATVFSME